MNEGSDSGRPTHGDSPLAVNQDHASRAGARALEDPENFGQVYSLLTFASEKRALALRVSR